jgi:hypothetical protein
MEAKGHYFSAKTRRVAVEFCKAIAPLKMLRDQSDVQS